MLQRIWPHDERHAIQWMGAAAIAYGVLFFLSNLFGEFLVPAERSDGEITRLGLFLVYVGAYGLGALALVPALRALDRVYRRRGGITRAGSVGLRAAAVGAAAHALFAILYFVTAAATGDAADEAFLLFALGFLLLIGGSMTAGVSIVRVGAERTIGALLLLTAAAAIVTVVTPAPAHDVALFLFAAGWAVLGLVLVYPVTRVLSWSVALAVAVALSIAPVALAAADVETTHFGGSVSASAENPCTGAPGTSSVTFTGVSHTTVTPGGSLHHTATVTGEIVFTPDDSSHPTYTGRFTAWDGQNGAPAATIISTATFHDMLRGSDGSRIRDRGLFHVTALADGTVTAALDRFVLICG